jgi:predicted TIM-barrel fold metal-dependent hydrolase
MARRPAVLSLLPLLLAMAMPAAAEPPSRPPNQILLKDYRPVVIHNVPVTRVDRARFPAVDMHSHHNAKTAEDVDRWVSVMDEVGVARTVILTGAHGEEFERIAALYARHPTRFELWCGFDYDGYDQPGYGPAAVAALESCARTGGRGIGEEGDKGAGADWGQAKGMHFDDPRMDPLFEACARLGLPVNVHVADPIWMYQKMDETNDGLMNALEWRLDDKPGILGPSEMVDVLERTVRRHPRTTFVACHLANLDYDLGRLGRLLDALPNLYADFAARYAETAVVPRSTARFLRKYQDRLVYGTDMGFSLDMYRTTFRILESEDDHFYAPMFHYHWSYGGFALDASVLEKLYRANALAIMRRAQEGAARAAAATGR